MTLPQFLRFFGKVISVVLASTATLLISLLMAFHVVTYGESPLQGLPKAMVYAAVFLTTLTALGVAFRRLTWNLRVLAAAMLLVGGSLLLPHAVRTAENQTVEGR